MRISSDTSRIKQPNTAMIDRCLCSLPLPPPSASYHSATSDRSTPGAATLNFSPTAVVDVEQQFPVLPPVTTHHSPLTSPGSSTARFGILIAPHLRWKTPNRNKKTSENQTRRIFSSRRVVDYRSFMWCCLIRPVLASKGGSVGQGSRRRCGVQ